MLTRVFDLFAQADQSLDRSEGGLGIGLTVARRLAEMHGGSVSAASAGLGRGSQFVVRLPLADGSGADGALGGDPMGAGRRPAPRRRVLVVDDNRDTARSGAKLLELQGHEVRVAFDGLAALEAAREFQPEVMLLDIGLPGMSGYELVKRLREEGFEQATIVAVSGYGQQADKERSREAGFDDHLVKPVDREALALALERVRVDLAGDI
jgi:CheY-like chemotaxis protein